MKNKDQANNTNNLNDPTVGNDPQAQAEFEDLPISGEQEERVKGGPGGYAKDKWFIADSFSFGVERE